MDQAALRRDRGEPDASADDWNQEELRLRHAPDEPSVRPRSIRVHCAGRSRSYTNSRSAVSAHVLYPPQHAFGAPRSRFTQNYTWEEAHDFLDLCGAADRFMISTSDFYCPGTA
jgi:hypothetical protein